MYRENARVVGTEIDLIFYKDHWHFVEVKSVSDWSRLHFRLCHSQITRLLRAREFWQNATGEETQLQVAYVKGDQVKVLDIEDHL